MGAKVGHEVSEETRIKISTSLMGRSRPDIAERLRGKKQSPEHVRKRAEAQRRHSSTCKVPECGKPHESRGWCAMHYYRWKKHGDPLLLPRRPSGAANPNWKGAEIGYDAAHWRAKSTLPRVCQSCGATEGRLEIALRKDADPTRLRNHPRDGSPYSADPTDYARLCVRCHRRYDSPREDTRAPIIEALRR